MIKRFRIDERLEWDIGTSTRYAKKLTTQDIKTFLESRNIVVKKIRRLRRKIFGNTAYVVEWYYVYDNISQMKSYFIPYDFCFSFTSYKACNYDAWFDFMSKKFGKEYSDFEVLYEKDDIL